MLNISQKATRELTKSHNQRLVLKTIYDRQQTSRADVARLTHLTRTTVSTAVAELMEAGLVEEVGFKPSGGGKPATLLSVVADSRYLIGIDLANSEFRGAVVNLRGEVKYRHSIPVVDFNGEGAVQMVYVLIEHLLASAYEPIVGIGIGSPGLMNPHEGIVRTAINLNWQNLPLGALLEARFNLPVYIANDSQVAALAEYTFGDSKTVSNLAVIKVGRGISAGIIISRQLFYGDGFGAGEIGHLMVVENGEPCLCGRRGCLETVSNSRILIKQAQALATANPASPLNRLAASPAAITTDLILQAFNAGDADLEAIVARMGSYLGIAAASLIATLNIQRLVIAGSLARFDRVLRPAAVAEMHRRIAPIFSENTIIAASPLGTDIVLLGAASLVLANELGLIGF